MVTRQSPSELTVQTMSTLEATLSAEALTQRVPIIRIRSISIASSRFKHISSFLILKKYNFDHTILPRRDRKCKQSRSIPEIKLRCHRKNP